MKNLIYSICIIIPTELFAETRISLDCLIEEFYLRILEENNPGLFVNKVELKNDLAQKNLPVDELEIQRMSDFAFRYYADLKLRSIAVGRNIGEIETMNLNGKNIFIPTEIFEWKSDKLTVQKVTVNSIYTYVIDRQDLSFIAGIFTLDKREGQNAPYWYGTCAIVPEPENKF